MHRIEISGNIKKVTINSSALKIGQCVLEACDAGYGLNSTLPAFTLQVHHSHDPKDIVRAEVPDMQ